METINKLVAQGAIELDYTSAEVPIIKLNSTANTIQPIELDKMHNELLAHQEDYRKGLVKKPVKQPEKTGFFKRAFNKIMGR